MSRLLLAVLALANCRTSPLPYVLEIPPGFPAPVIPEDNPLTAAKVELGRHLFYDRRLSGNETQSCGSCHVQALAFTDGRITSVGSTNGVHPRNSMSLANVAYASTLTWANPLQLELEVQALVPILGTSPIVELGVEGREDEVLARFSADARYQRLFAEAFPQVAAPFTLNNVAKALSSFQRTLLSGNSPYDRYTYQGDKAAMSESAVRGQALFFSERMECFHCHEGFNFSAATHTEKSMSRASAFFNNGLYNIDGLGAYPADNRGVMEVSGDARDMGRFKPPTLRNIAVTAPYMHDGSIATLEEVIRDHYGRGGRLLQTGAHAGDGNQSPLKSGLIRGFVLSEDELRDVVAFLESLTDESFLQNPAFSDPF